MSTAREMIETFTVQGGRRGPSPFDKIQRAVDKSSSPREPWMDKWLTSPGRDALQSALSILGDDRVNRDVAEQVASELGDVAARKIARIIQRAARSYGVTEMAVPRKRAAAPEDPIETTAQLAVEEYLNSNSYVDMGMRFGPWFEDEFFQHPALMNLYDVATRKWGEDDRADREYDRMVAAVKRRARAILAARG